MTSPNDAVRSTAVYQRTAKDIFLGILKGIADFFRLMAHNRVGFIGFIIVVLYFVVSFLGPLVIPVDTETRIARIFEKPSWQHPLGMDHEGRDTLSQVINGGRDILTTALLTAIISTSIGVTLGATSAVLGGGVDTFLSAFADIFMSIPQFPLQIVLAGFIQVKSMIVLSLILAILSWTGLYRAVRAQVLSLRERDYIEAAVLLDLGTRHIVFKEILPNMMSYIAISFAFAMTGAIYAQTGLVLLGLVPFSSHNWGVMISIAWTRGAIFFKDSAAYILAPVFTIAMFQLAMVWMTRSLEEVFNPRLRGRA
ncbi:MAG: ABC transporter permease [Anaerolineae bacterium]|nr:ABC transporter permease [Anaerolineae bacterium]